MASLFALFKHILTRQSDPALDVAPDVSLARYDGREGAQGDGRRPRDRRLSGLALVYEQKPL